MYHHLGHIHITMRRKLFITKWFVVFLIVFGIVGIAKGDWTQDADDKMCLAKNIYFEAKNQPLIGQLAVAIVVLNRVKDHRFPNTICEVITQGPTLSWTENFPVRHRCQFSWYCDGRSDKPKHKKKWENSLKIASLVLAYKENVNDIIFILDDATFYHADYVYPAWRKSKKQIVQIGDHIFYKWL